MSQYATRGHPVREDGFQFDSILERDWAGFVTHTGLKWKREPFSISREPGPTSMRNVIGRPDFFLPDPTVFIECKPTPEMLWEGEVHWREESERTGIPVLVTGGKPQPTWASTHEGAAVEISRRLARRNPERWAGVGFEVLLPPILWMFRERHPAVQVFFARCPDCVATGLLAIGPDFSLDRLDIALWLSPCRHQPKWSSRTFHDAITIFPRIGEIRLCA